MLSALCFNFFHIPPTGRLSISDGENWVALVVFFVAAAIASTLAELARSRAEDAELRRREANLSADLARLLLVDVAPDQALGDVSRRLAEAMGIEWAAVAFDADRANRPDAVVIPLAVDGEPDAVLLVPADIGSEQREQLSERVAPALATLLTAAVERRRLGAEAVEAQALRRSDELKTALLRSVSHDLRTPLTSIVAAGEALGSAGITAEERAELAEVVQLESTRLSRLVDQLLDLSRLEAGAADPRREWSSLEEIVHAAADQIPGGGFELAFEPGLPLVNADGAQLERALVNVLENAKGHSAGEPVSVHGRAVGSRLVLRIVDRGIGVPQSELERIFEPFYRGESARSSGRGGSGLGLAIARGFVTANGGTIRAESLPSQGTAVVIELPVEVQPSGAAAAGSTGANRGGAMNGPRVLVCDDEPQIIRALRVVLRDAGFVVVAASDGEEALDHAAVQPPDAAIIDLVLPDIDGVEVTRRLREWTTVPIIVLSAVGDEVEKVRALDAGADDYVTKPFGPKELVARLQATMRRAGSVADEPLLVTGGLEVDLAARVVRRAGEEIHLTPIEFELMAALARSPGRLLTHRALLTEVWGPGHADETAVLRTHIANLRRKIDPDGTLSPIRTDPGVGYRLK